MDLMESSTFYQGLSYALCTICGLAILLSIMVSVISVSHRHLRKDRSLRYIRYSELLMALANFAAGCGIILVVLWPGIKSSVFCDAGSFLMLFGFMESTWMLFVCCTTLMIQMKSTVKVRRLLGRSQLVTSGHRWSFPIFLLSMLLKAVVLAMLVFLSLTKKDLFKNSDTDCQLVGLVGQVAWEYTAALVVLAWAAVLPATVLSLCNIFLYGPKLLELCHVRYSTGLKYNSKEKFSHRLAIVYLITALLWIVVLMTTTVIVFSGEDIITMEYVNLALGYSFTLAIAFSMAAAVVVLIMNRRWRQAGILSGFSDKDALLNGSPPNSLASVSKLPQQKDEVRRYHVQWLDKRGQVTSGVMKTFHPACLKRWRCEVNAIAKLSVASHPNVAEYMWETHKNKFVASVCSFTGDLLSPECSITCMMYYPHGTLGNYLKTRSHMTEVGLHKVTLDIARGLGFIHQNHLVHNGLTTETIYMSSISGKIGLRSVIGDFESSYEVSENTLRKSPLNFERPYVLDTCSFGSLYSISQQMDLDNNKFAPDIRSFGMVVLEMLIALGEFDEHSGIGIHYRSQDIRRNSLYDNTSLGSSQSQPMERKQVLPAGGQLDVMGSDSHLNQLNCNKSHHNQHSNSKTNCKCAPRVTDIRALRHGRSDDPHGEQTNAKSSCESLCRDSSTFASLRSLEESTIDCSSGRHTKDTSRTHNCSSRARELAMQVVRKRATAIQNRDLPPVPPRHHNSSKSSAKKHKGSRPTCDIIRPAVADSLAMAHPNTETTTGQPNLLQLQDFPNMVGSGNYDFSPSSDEFYTLSVGSLGSFETIYEDDERTMTGHTHYQNTSSVKTGHKLVTGKPPVFKRKTHEEPAHKKRYSISSANDSVFSSDSGVGSYASDTYSDLYAHRLWKDAHRGRKDLESPDTTYHPRSRRQPFSKRHPGPGQICVSDPGFSTTGPTDSSASNTDTMSSDEPTYECIGAGLSAAGSKERSTPPRLQSKKRIIERNSLMTSSADSLRLPMRDLISGPHPVIKQQYRFAVPRLGISAVLARRLSDASLSSVNSHRSTDLSHSVKDIKCSNTNLSGSKSNVSMDTRGGAERQDNPESSELTKDHANDTSLSSSILSIIQDSNTLLDDTASVKNTTTTSAQHTSSTPSRFTKSSKNSVNSSRTSLSKTQLNQYNELTKLSKFLDCVSLDPKEKARMLSMLKLISRNDRLGFIGHQLMSLFSDCWLEDPVPSAGEILERLNLVMPSASV